MSGFEQLRIYQQALDGVKMIYVLVQNPEIRRDFSLVDQIKRAAMSVVANIAEGYGRHSKKDFHHFISIALGSANEVIAHLDVVGIIYPKIELKEVREFYIRLGKQLWAFRQTLQTHNS